MPFLDHFGLREYPFSLTPDPFLFFPSAHAQALLEALLFSLRRGDGLLKVVGGVGTGKTMLCRMLLEKLEGTPVNSAYLNAPMATNAAQMPLTVLREFGLEPPPDATSNEDAVARQLRDYLLREHGQGRANILIVDEAQALGAAGLEAIRLLSNLETDRHKLLQIVLFGQTELDALLRRREMRQVAQRLNFSFATQPLTADATASYVRFRLERCARSGTQRAHFAPAALRCLARASGGLPRLINLLCDKALLAAFAEGNAIIHPRHIRAARRETPEVGTPWWPWRLRRAA